MLMSSKTPQFPFPPKRHCCHYQTHCSPAAPGVYVPHPSLFWVGWPYTAAKIRLSLTTQAKQKSACLTTQPSPDVSLHGSST